MKLFFEHNENSSWKFAFIPFCWVFTYAMQNKKKR